MRSPPKPAGPPARWSTTSRTSTNCSTSRCAASIERRSARRSERSNLSPADALRATLESALPTDADTRVHWIVTVALAGAAASDDGLATTQREAYRDYRSYVIDLLDAIAYVDDTEVEAERLIGLVDGIALQALFDPDAWPPERQRRALDAGLTDERDRMSLTR